MREILEPYLPDKQRGAGGDNSYTGGGKSGGDRQAPLKKVA